MNEPMKPTHDPSHAELIKALIDSTQLMSNMITNCRTSVSCEGCALFKCKLIKRCEENEEMLSQLESCGHSEL